MDVVFIRPRARVRKDFDAGKSITRSIVRALNIETFLAPEIALSRQASAISGPQKVEMFRPLTMAQVMDLPASKSLRTGPYKYSVHW